jgi:hypothetical protein
MESMKDLVVSRFEELLEQRVRVLHQLRMCQ